ncbi:LOW QUALITY PROTEIN: hypothetical protein CFC21_099855 [Triticum aestivum]|uniref:BTB domain-containing protein n=2 Tax=Triticum aestivum TaxID=4565 RepID=A0A3B6RQN9_WHEAT|nr:LOW QUALITY PROTEIN: hypothetical protein CFC21_099855 [Triticum aestivum]
MASACTNLTDATRLVQVLKIDGYSASTSSGDCIKSRWIVDGYEWEIQLYPATSQFGIAYEYNEPLYRKSTKSKFVDGKSSWDPAYCSRWVAVKLAFLGEPGTSKKNYTVKATLGCRLIDQRGVVGPSQEKSMSHQFLSPQESGSPAPAVVLIEMHDLAESGYLRDNLAVECAITVKVVAPPPPTNLHQHLRELLRSGTGADVTFIVSGESFAAHKLILASRSPVFMAEFFGAMKEKRSRRVEVQDMEASAFRAMLHFIYTDTVPELDPRVEQVATMAQHLLAGADRYGLDKLICESKLSHGITVETAATTLALAEQHNCSQLKAKCIEFIVSTTAVLDAVLVATEGYKHLEASCPLVLADLLKSARGRNLKRSRR